MKKLLIVILIEIVSASGLIAQEFKKEWADGKLTWEDFKEREGSGGQRISELKYYLGYNSGKQKYGDTVISRNIAHGYMDKNLSWVNPGYKTEQHLRYNQVVFDIVEVHRRRLQLELDRISSGFEFQGKFQVINHSCANEIERFNRETNGGKNLNLLVFWEQKISDELNSYKQTHIPDFETRNFGYGMHVGLGTGFFTGTISEHFSPTFNFIFGFDFAYKKSIFYFNGTLAVGKVRQDYTSDKNWYKNQSANLAVIDVSYGYAFLDNRKLKLAPFAGFGITELSRKDKDNKDRLRMVDYNVIFGINADYKLRTRINLLPNPFFGAAVKEKVEMSVRARLYVTRANLTSDLSGYSVNLTIGLCGFGNMIRVK